MRRIIFAVVFSAISASGQAQNIHRTACQGNLHRLDSLLAETTIGVTDNRGRSLLHWAVACKKEKVFDYLIEKGIAVNAEDNQGRTPLHVAVQFNNEKYFDLLLDQQPNEEWKSRYGASLLEQAVLKANKALIRKLIEVGVGVNSTNQRGSTALEISQRIESNDISELLLSLGADQNLVRTFKMEGELMGQTEPGTTPVIFAPNFISTEEDEFGSVFNAGGTEFYFGVDVGGKNEIRYSALIEGSWSKPRTILSHDRYGYNDPFLSPDESRLYFISNRAPDGIGEAREDRDIWYVERTKQGWSEPINAGPNINSAGNEFYISFTSDGTMYFSSNINAPEGRRRTDLDIYHSRFLNGEFQEAIRLEDSVNTDAYEADVFIDPEERYLIFCGERPTGFGRGDLYISFRNADGTWTKALNMGKKINTRHYEYCPFVTKDGKYLFYTSNQDIYWVSTEILKELKEN